MTFICRPIDEVYHEIFDKAVEEYNSRQKRKDRRIDTGYFEYQFGRPPTTNVVTSPDKRNSFYEDVVQIGCKDDTAVGTGDAGIAKECLVEYMNGFQERNPNFIVFNAVLHMDEASPHLHIDFIPFYTKGRSFPSILNSSISDTFAAVLFPVMSKIQDDKQRLLQYTRMYIKVASYMIFPVLFGFFAVSDSFIAILLGKHWLPAADYIRIFCLSYMFNILTKGNLQVIKAIGRSDIHLILEIIKKVSFLIVIIAFLFVAKTPVFFAYASIVNSVIALLVNTYPNKKLIGYDIKTQLLDIMPNFIIALIMGVSIYMMNYIVINRIVLLCLQIVSGALIYLMISFVVKPEGFTKSFSIIKKTIKGDKNEE